MNFIVLKALNNKSGEDLFEMSRPQLISLVGVEDTGRLESLLKVEKNIAGVRFAFVFYIIE